MIGTKLAHYTIVRKLGEGGMGVVFEAKDDRLNRAVALKFLPRDAVADRARQQRFVREAKAASALNHPNIVTIYEISNADGQDYIAMEVIRGDTLEHLLARGKLLLKDILKFAAQIVDALAAAHAAGIVHRDLKPGNVMINERGDVKLLDFGLAKLTEVSEVSEEDETKTVGVITEADSIVGSSPYMSPEQAEGRPVDARSDIFSFGAVLYEMLTGRRAFVGASRVATLAAVIKDDPAPVRSIAPDAPPEVKRTRLALFIGCGLLVASAGVWLWKQDLQPAMSDISPTVLTSFIGAHGDPTVSPDGNQFAFEWDGDVPNGRKHIYVSLIGKVSPLRLTPENESSEAPAWSPDGQSIAYVRDPGTNRSELVVMTALGGASRVIGSGKLGIPTWSPDSKWLVWSQQEENSVYSLRIVPAGGGEPRRLLTPGNYKADAEPVVSPDGRQILFVRTAADFDTDLYLADLHDGQLMGSPRRVTSDHHSKWSPIWVAAGKEILYISGEAFDEAFVYRMPSSGGQARRIDSLGGRAAKLAFAAHANRLVYSTYFVNYDIERLPLGSTATQAERFLSSTRFECCPSYSPDGKRIAFSSDRTGVTQIWVANADGSNPVALTSLESGIAGSAQWSPDGYTIAFDARPDLGADIYTIPASGGTAKRLTDYSGEDHVPSWSPDGKWIYFGSRRSGGHEVFRMRADGNGVQQMTHNDGLFGMVSPDGKWLYYSTLRNGLWKMPAEGVEPTQVLSRTQVNGILSFTLAREGIYANGRDGAGGFPIVFYPFDHKAPQVLTVLKRAPYLNPAVSPDGAYPLYTISDDPVYGIMTVDNFR